MGYQVTLQIVYQDTYTILPDPPTVLAENWREIEEQNTIKKPIWSAQEKFPLGRLTRIEKLTSARYAHLTHTAHERAGICLMEVVLEQIENDLDVPQHQHFAPPILVYEYPGEEHWLLRGMDATIVPVNMGNYSSYYTGRPLMQLDDLKGHNDLVKLSPTELIKKFTGLGPLMAHNHPVLWRSCSEVADLLDKAELSGHQAWQEVRKDSAALAIFRARRSYMREVGVTEARVLFIFEH